MEFWVRSGDSFEQIERCVVDALARQDFVVRRSFSLLSAGRSGPGPASEDGESEGLPGFSVLWLYAPDGNSQPRSLATLYQRGGQTMLRVTPASMARAPLAAPGSSDVEAELIAALVLDGLDVCLGPRDDRRCVDPAKLLDGGTHERDVS